MTKLNSIIVILFLIATFPDKNFSVGKPETDCNKFDLVKVSNPGNILFHNIVEVLSVDTTTVLKFKELSFSIKRLISYYDENSLNNIQNDTIIIYAELGETIEGQEITIVSDQLTEIMVEQRYETSITIMNEGPHCDLIDWKHYLSEWTVLKKNKYGKYKCETYSESDKERFPKISIVELKKTVKEFCGEDWYRLIANIKEPTEYPIGIGISRFYLRIQGLRNDNMQRVTKIIIVEMPLGC